MNVFAKLSEMIVEIGYESISQSQTSKATYTLHTAIRDLCNMAKHEAKQLTSGTRKIDPASRGTHNRR